jgi:dCMP deaminase
MKKQKEMDETYLKMTKTWSELSYCTRKKVGALIVKNGMIISDGFNGTPSKSKPNVCEDINGETYWWVLHGEANAILKCAKHGQSCNGATLYQTCSPCKDCSKLILQSGIKRVVYIEDYKDLSGIELLLESGIIVDKMIV